MTEAAPESEPSSEPLPAASRRIVVTALLLAIAWWGFLAVLAWRTGRPATLNRAQISQADYVVTGTISADGRSVDVEREWKRGADLDRVQVANLDQTRARPGRIWLIPLSRTRAGRYEVTGTPPDGRPLVYPVTPETIEQLRTLLKQIPPAGRDRNGRELRAAQVRPRQPGR